jgi:hypothetical protein
MRELTLAAAAAACALVAAPRAAGARTVRNTAYRYQQVFGAAVRHLRVDEGFEIVDQDADAGYVVFEMIDDKKKFHGALEVVRYEEGERPMVRLILTIADRPAYMEAAVLERILAKLRDELGDEPAPPPPPEKKPPRRQTK